MKESFEEDKNFAIKSLEKFLGNQEKKKLEKKKGPEIGDFIRNLEISMNEKSGIELYAADAEGDKNTSLLIRDAREYKAREKSQVVEPILMQNLNLLRAAEDFILYAEPPISDISKKALSQYFKDKAKEIYDKYEKGDFKDIRSANKEMLLLRQELVNEIYAAGLEDSTAKKFSKKSLKSDLKKLLEYQTYKDKQYNIATISAAGTVEMDVYLRSVSDKSKNRFDDLDNQEWFKVLSKVEQNAMKKKYKNIIMEGKHAAPTQHTYIPRPRNAGMRYFAKIANDKLERIYQAAHSGTPALVFKKLDKSVDKKKLREEAVDITAENIEAMKQVMSPENKLVTNSLVSSVRESGIINQIEKAADKSADVDFVNTPVNFVRNISIGRYKAINDVLKTIDLSKESEDLDVREFIDLCKSLKNNISRASSLTSLFWDPSNVNLEIASQLHQLENIFLKQGGENPSAKIFKHLGIASESDEAKTLQARIVSGCKSGKDREGLMLFRLLSKLLKLNKDEKKQLSEAGHTQNVPGSVFAGVGTIGNFGLKKSTIWAVPYAMMAKIFAVKTENHKSELPLFGKNADGIKKIPKPKRSFTSRFNQNKPNTGPRGR